MSEWNTPSVDILVLNAAVVDFRGPPFGFTADLVGQGGLAKCQTHDMPDYSQSQLKAWIDQGHASAGGPGNYVAAVGSLDNAIDVLKMIKNTQIDGKAILYLHICP